LRAAAEDALALIENRPSFKQALAAFGAPAQSSSSYVNPRRYASSSPGLAASCAH